MDNNKSQHYNYTHETIPSMWHSQTEEFLKYLDLDGVVFLRFWWKHLSDNLGIQILSDSSGLGYQIKELADKNGKSVKLVLLSLPKPQNIGEVYYMLLSNQKKRNPLFEMFMTHLPSTRVLALELEGIAEDGTPKTGLYEITVRTRNVRMGKGCEPVLDTFYKTCLDQLKFE